MEYFLTLLVRFVKHLNYAILQTHLKVLCQHIDIAAFFVVKIGIGPEELCFLFKDTPGLELAHSSCVMSSLHTFDNLLQLFDRQRIGYDFVVVFQSPGREIDKRLEIGIIIAEKWVMSVKTWEVGGGIILLGRLA